MIGIGPRPLGLEVLEYVIEVERYIPGTLDAEMVLQRGGLTADDFPFTFRSPDGYYRARVTARSPWGWVTSNVDQFQLGSPSKLMEWFV